MKPNQKSKAVVLLSGGLDSATAAALALADGFECVALSFHYGQRHTVELEAARRVAADLGITDHRFSEINLRAFGQSALTDAIAVPKGRSMERMEEEIPITYVPARNIIFLSYALALAETVPCQDIYIGVNVVDYSGYPDCRPEFIAQFQLMANLGTKAGVEGHPFRIHTPLITWTKAQIIQAGVELGVNYAHTHSCYDPDSQGRACGQCDSCLLRKKGFAEAAVPDPTVYA
ncbi:MAG: 7-cyano-7-deazaguanine synthase QueC [bacterium]|jgi:7-cyano-7-deazaguanine synthase|nr:7-cyano-7-deazaguanine synthase QueC [bacterium]